MLHPLFGWRPDIPKVISAEKNLPAAMNQRIIKALQDHIAPKIFAETRVVFDGRKNLFAPVELNLGGNSREVCAPFVHRTHCEIKPLISSM